MEFFVFIGAVLLIVSILLIRGRSRGSQSGPYDTAGSRPIGEIDLARHASGRSVQGGPGENKIGAGRGIAGLGGNSSKAGPSDGPGD